MMTILITGASKGIGHALAHEFAKHGHDLVITARDRHLLNQLAIVLRMEHSVQVDTIAIDLSRGGSALRLVGEVEAKGHQIDCLVNNAGIGYLGDFTEMSTEYLNEMMQLNMVALSELTHHYAQVFVKANKGKILQVASIAAFQPGPKMAAYYASKAYIVSLSRALAYELKETGVSLSILCPGATHTNFMQQANMDDSILAKGYLGLMSAEKVAKIAYRGLEKNKLIIIPGLLNKILAYSALIAPSALSTRIAAFFHTKLGKNEE